MLEEIASAIQDYFLLIILAVALIILGLALKNRKKVAQKDLMNFYQYKNDWKKAHMYQEEINQDVRSGFNNWLKFNFTLSRHFAKVGFTPNLASALAFLLSIASAYCFIRVGLEIGGNFFVSDLYIALAVAFLLLSGLMDVVDGAISRLSYSSSPFGDFLDNVLDKYSDAIVLIGLVIAGLVTPIVGLAALVGSFLVDYARARTMGLGLKRTKVTIGERPFRMILISGATSFQFVAQFAAAINIIVPIGNNMYLHQLFLSSIQWGVLALAVLTHFSTIQIAFHAKKNLPREPPPQI